MEISEETLVKLVENSGCLLTEMKNVKDSITKMEAKIDKVTTGIDDKLILQKKELLEAIESIKKKQAELECRIEASEEARKILSPIITPIRYISSNIVFYVLIGGIAALMVYLEFLGKIKIISL